MCCCGEEFHLLVGPGRGRCSLRWVVGGNYALGFLDAQISTCLLVVKMLVLLAVD